MKTKQLVNEMSVTMTLTEAEMEILEAIFSYDLKNFVDLAGRFKKESVEAVICDMRQELSSAKKRRDDCRNVLSGQYQAVRRLPEPNAKP